jgi:L-arabinose isomerase
MKVALVPIYVDYYEALVPGVRIAKEELLQKVVAAIENGHEVCLLERVTSVASARLARQKLGQTKPDCVVVLPLVAAFSALTDELARGWHAPLVLLSAMAGTKVPADLTMPKVVAESQSFGCQAVANGWQRQGIKFYALHQIPGTMEGDAALRRLLRSIELHQQIGRLRIGQIGETFAEMSDVVLPQKAFEARTGARIVRIPMKHVLAFMAKVSKQELVEFEKKLAKTFAFGRFSRREKEISLRAAIAIQQLVSEKQLDCAAFNSHGSQGLKSEKLGLMCALGLALATSSGCPMAEVGDLCTAFAMWVGRNLGGAAYYTELDSAYISDHNWLLLNSGEYDLQWLRPGFRPRLLPNSNFTGVNGRGISLCAPLRTGPATLINFTPTPHADRPYRLLVCEGTVIEDWVSEMQVGNAYFRVNGDARALYEQWLAAGPVHHSSTSPGHLAMAIQIFCQLQNWNFMRIG